MDFRESYYNIMQRSALRVQKDKEAAERREKAVHDSHANLVKKNKEQEALEKKAKKKEKDKYLEREFNQEKVAEKREAALNAKKAIDKEHLDKMR